MVQLLRPLTRQFSPAVMKCLVGKREDHSEAMKTTKSHEN
jgi:hypothetical protein